MSEQKPREWFLEKKVFSDDVVAYADKNALAKARAGHGINTKVIHVIEKSAFDKAVVGLRNTDCKCKPYRNIYGGIDTPPPCIRCEILKDLGVET